MSQRGFQRCQKKGDGNGREENGFSTLSREKTLEKYIPSYEEDLEKTIAEKIYTNFVECFGGT